LTAAIEVVRQAFTALEAGDTDTAFAALAQAGGAGTTLRLAEAWPAGPELVLAHLVRRAGPGAGPLQSDVATILRVENDAITEIVTVSSRALDTYWSTAT
jgi:hypothetical protein